LRLVGAEHPSAALYLRETAEQRAVAAANRASADAADALTDADARLIFAKRVSEALEGGRRRFCRRPGATT
jgi:protein involved in temperature-dependent protein secretion